MDRISIYVSKDELDFIREAVAQRYLSLMTYFNTCEEESQQQGSFMAVPDLTKGADDQLDKKIVAKRAPRKSKAAPYGYKKDGTPKKQPGRKKVAA